MATTRSLSEKDTDFQLMVAAEVHLGTKNCNFQMERYVFKRRNDGIHIINLGKTWEKLQLAARVIVSIENPQDIIVQSARPYGQRAVLKFAQYTGAHAIAGRHTPGTFTNQLQTSFSEPRLLILTDPRTDHQMVLQMRGTIRPGHKWDVMVDLFFYREPEEAKPEEDDEVVALPTDYPDYSTGAADQWPAQISDAAWPETAPAASGWTAEGVAPAGGDGWDAAVAPVVPDGAVDIPPTAAAGWE
ncbi:hypothetical protein ACFE04_021821 [Oxalis oulophora]